MEEIKEEMALKVQTDDKIGKERNYDRLVAILQRVIEKGEQSGKPDVEKALDKDWDEICEMLDFCRELSEVIVKQRSM